MADLALTGDGDLMLNESGDLALVEGPSFVVQSVYNRIKSVTVDWFYDNIGADLIDFLGYPNTRDTAKCIEARLISTLTAGGLLDTDSIFVKVVPVSRTTLSAFVFIKLTEDENESPVGFEISINLDGGVSVKYV